MFSAFHVYAATPLVEEGRKAKPEHYRYAVEQGAKIVPTPDGRSFYLVWLPPDFENSSDRPMVVTLHGHANWAFTAFSLWHPHLEKRGIGIVALQWWFGKGEAPHDYYTPREMYPVIEKILKEQSVKPRSALLHGFSRAATNVYALAALDRKTENDLFGLIVADAGGMVEDYPPNAEILSGSLGRDVFKGTHWVVFCGEQDPNPDRDGCSAMQATSDWVRAYGGVVELFIDDPEAGHGGFHRNPQHVEEALDIFDMLFAAA